MKVFNEKIIGITGGIATGKSTVSRILKNEGCNIIDADAICHDLYESNNETLVSEISKRWGQNKVFDKKGNINRKKIAEIVFKNEKELNWLNSIIHPLILNEAKKKYKSSKLLNLFDAPLLFESGWRKYFFKIITVWAPEHISFKRIKSRNPDWPDNEISSRLRAQMPINKKLEKSNFGVINTVSFKLLKEQSLIIKNKFERYYNG